MSEPDFDAAVHVRLSSVFQVRTRIWRGCLHARSICRGALGPDLRQNPLPMPVPALQLHGYLEVPGLTLIQPSCRTQPLRCSHTLKSPAISSFFTEVVKISRTVRTMTTVTKFTFVVPTLCMSLSPPCRDHRMSLNSDHLCFASLSHYSPSIVQRLPSDQLVSIWPARSALPCFADKEAPSRRSVRP